MGCMDSVSVKSTGRRNLRTAWDRKTYPVVRNTRFVLHRIFERESVRDRESAPTLSSDPVAKWGSSSFTVALPPLMAVRHDLLVHRRRIPVKAFVAWRETSRLARKSFYLACVALGFVRSMRL